MPSDVAPWMQFRRIHFKLPHSRRRERRGVPPAQFPGGPGASERSTLVSEERAFEKTTRMAKCHPGDGPIRAIARLLNNVSEPLHRAIAGPHSIH